MAQTASCPTGSYALSAKIFVTCLPLFNWNCITRVANFFTADVKFHGVERHCCCEVTSIWVSSYNILLFHEWFLLKWGHGNIFFTFSTVLWPFPFLPFYVHLLHRVNIFCALIYYSNLWIMHVHVVKVSNLKFHNHIFCVCC